MDNNYNWALDLDYISHYGTPRHSGRYPWGSGAKWGKKPLGEAANRIKEFFKKKKPAENRVDIVPDSKRMAQLSNALQDSHTGDNSNPLNKLSDDERKRLEKHLKDEDPDKEDLFNLLDKAYGKHYSMSDMDISLQNAKKDLKSIGDEDSKPKEPTPQETKQDHEAARKAALDSGDRNEIAKYFNESSYGELQQALQKAELKDKLNESLAKAYKEAHPEPPQQKTPTAEEQRKDYVKQELWSGDLNRILAVASDKSVNEDELKKALNKADQMATANAKANPTRMEKVKAILDKGINAYDTIAPIYNIAAATNNYLNPNTKLPIAAQNVKEFVNNAKNIPVKQPQNPQPQQQNQSQSNQQQNQSNQQKQQPQQQNNQPKSNPQPQQSQKQQQVETIKNWLNTDTLKNPQSERFYQNTIANIVDKPISSQSKNVEFTPQNNNGNNNPTDMKWLKMTIDPSVLNRKL